MLKSSIKKLVMITVVGNILAGGSGFIDIDQDQAGETAPLTNKQRQDLLEMLNKSKESEALLAQWRQSKDGVARLLAIESDLKELIEQLSQLSDDDVNNPINQDVQQEVKPTVRSSFSNDSVEMQQQVSFSDAEPIKELNSDANELFVIQLSAMNNEENIVGVWNEIVQKQSLILGGLLPSTERVELPSGLIYRLKAGQFKTLKDAQVVCDKLRLVNIPCIVSRYTRNTKLVPLKVN